MDISPIASTAVQHGEFAQAMVDTQLSGGAVDRYVEPTNSMATQMLGGVVESEASTSHSYRAATDALQQRVAELDLGDPLASMQSMFDLQMRVGEAQLKVQFATSLAQSVNHGFSTLFQLQN